MRASVVGQCCDTVVERVERGSDRGLDLIDLVTNLRVEDQNGATVYEWNQAIKKAIAANRIAQEGDRLFTFRRTQLC